MSYHYAILAAVLAQRVWELQFSWRKLREAAAAEQARPLPEPGFPVMVAVHAAWFAGCFAEVALLEPAFRAGLILPLLAVWAGSLGLRYWVISSLGALWNVRLVERARQPVVTGGPFRYIRHPNYLAVIVEIAVIPLLVGAYWTALLGSLGNALVLWRRIAAEESHLFQTPAYRDAFARKKRLIPGVF